MSGPKGRRGPARGGGSSGGRGGGRGGQGGGRGRDTRSRGGSGQRGSTPVRGRSTEPPKGLGGDQVEGRHAVRELLLAGTRRTREVVLAAEMDSAPILDDIIDLADEARVTIRELPRSKFESMARTDAPQGVLAMAAPLRDYGLEELLHRDSSGADPFLLMLDGITDPGNLGAILRSAECAGVTGVVMPRHRAARVSPTAAKAAAGAVEHLRMASVSGLPKAMGRLADAGIWSVGLDVGGDQLIHDLKVADQPLALVMGAEGAVNIIHRREIAAADDDQKENVRLQLVEEYSLLPTQLMLSN